LSGGIDAALIPHGATNKDTVVVARAIQDHYEALERMFDFVGGQRSLSTGYVRSFAGFSTWLDGVVVRGLNEWRRSL
jgi:hypothetical protein